MDPKFTVFSNLPPEVRQLIWRHALDQEWSYSHPRRVNRSIKFFGKIHQEVGQTCREPREVMQISRTGIESMRWINFDRHLFLFRDTADDLSLMKRGLNRFQLLEQIQHMVIYPRGAGKLWDTLEVIQEHCKSLKNLIIIGPWFDPGPLLANGRDDLMSLAPSHPDDEWEPSALEIFGSIDMNPLLEAIETEDAVARTAQLRANVEEGIRHMPETLDARDIEYTACGFMKTRLEAIEQMVQEFPHSKPNVYYRTKHELCPLTVFRGNGDLRVPET